MIARPAPVAAHLHRMLDAAPVAGPGSADVGSGATPAEIARGEHDRSLWALHRSPDEAVRKAADARASVVSCPR